MNKETVKSHAEAALRQEGWGFSENAEWHARQIRVALGLVKPVCGKDLMGLAK